MGSFPYLPLTDEEKREMIESIGIKDVDELFSDIPEKFKVKGRLELPRPHSEFETFKEAYNLSKRNKSALDMKIFIGAGIWPHYVPSVVSEVISRGEFLTSYTPYQPEMSQGMLQALFEYQSMMAELLDMDVVNASMYDWASALGEAALMAVRVKREYGILVPEFIHPERLSVLKAYTKPFGVKVERVRNERDRGMLDLEDVKAKIDGPFSALYVEVPSFFGILQEGLDDLSEVVHDSGKLLIVGVDPTSLGIIRPPGSYGADIVVGEGQPLGNYMALGGQTLGIFATKDERSLLRQMPGRIIGMTRTLDGNSRGFVMVLQSREQHIRREKATSNICTNNALNAVAAAVYMSLMGPRGFRRLGELILYNTNYAMRRMREIDGMRVPRFDSPHFKEFLVEFVGNKGSEEVHEELLRRNIQGGFIVTDYYPDLGDNMLFCFTELHSKDAIDGLVSSLKDIMG
ncbi:MAG: aminomethyl-transferring glycine dehydrogenase subunit GcvPA [Candidatus Asgardarchaeia archaeon]